MGHSQSAVAKEGCIAVKAATKEKSRISEKNKCGESHKGDFFPAKGNRASITERGRLPNIYEYV